MSRSKPTLDAAAVFVHGIGNHRPGTVLREMAEPVARAISELSDDGWTATISREPSSLTVELACRTGKKTHKIGLSEAIWADSFRRPYGLEMVSWALSRLPITAVSLAPDPRDESALRRMSADAPHPAIDRALIRPHELVAEAAAVLPFIGRTMQRLATASAILLLQLALWQWNHLVGLGGATLVTLAIVVVLSSPRLNIAGHVKVAAASGEGRAQMLQSVASEVDATCRRSRKVCVVGHSQGGYLAHQVLRAQHRSRVVSLIGVGSGLRPIRLLEGVSTRQQIAAIWLALAASLVGVVTISTALVLGSPAILTWLRTTLAASSLPIVLPSSAPVAFNAAYGSVPSYGELLTGALPSPDLIAGTAVGIVIYIILIVLSRMLSRPFDSDLSLPELPHTRWQEITTPHDLVGRLTYPSIPPTTAQHQASCGGNPLLDHLWYFKPHSPVRYLIAEELLRIAGVEHHRMPARELGAILARFASRRRALSSTLLWAGAGLIAGIGLLKGLSFAAAGLSAAIPLAIASAMVGVSFTLYERQSHKLLIQSFVGGHVPAPSTWGYSDRVSLAVLAGLAAALAGDVGIWQAALQSAPGFNLPFDSWLLFGVVAFFVAASVLAGYRVPPWIMPTFALLATIRQVGMGCPGKGFLIGLWSCPGHVASILISTLGVLFGVFAARESPVFRLRAPS